MRGTDFIVALGIDGQGHKRIRGLRQGATENARVCTDLLQDLVERGLSTKKPVIVVIDGSKALRKAVRGVLGPLAVVQRCQLHKRRNGCEYLPHLRQAQVEQQMIAASHCGAVDRARTRLQRLARTLERNHPDAAASLREGLGKTLTVLRLNLPPLLRQLLSSTNAIESVFATTPT